MSHSLTLVAALALLTAVAAQPPARDVDKAERVPAGSPGDSGRMPP